jgi:hypothetical protein
MLVNQILYIALVTAATAAPVIDQSLNSTQWTPDHVLQPGEVILFGNGRSKCSRQRADSGNKAKQAL